MDVQEFFDLFGVHDEDLQRVRKFGIIVAPRDR